MENEEFNVLDGAGVSKATLKKPKKVVETPERTDLEKKVISMYPQFNENQIAAMLMIQKQQVIEILNK